MTSLETAQRNMPQMNVASKWSNRFIWAAIVQGLAATLLTIPIVWPSSGLFGLKINPAVAQVIASGGAGTWYTVGYLSYIMVGVIAVGLTALFYYHFEVAMGKPYKGVANYFAWIHLALMNVGVAAAAYMLMWGGYFGGAALLTGQTAEWVHVNILSGLVNPIGYSIIIAGIGVLAGGVGYLVNYYSRR
jgi:heme/copper-type cytochrome/quinol oxidase subunit 1